MFTCFVDQKGVDPCEDVQCLNGGTCESVDEKTFKCTCLSDFTGKYCETRISKCKASSCYNGGTCEDVNDGTIRCNCRTWYKGTYCQTAVDACKAYSCHNGGTCRNLGNGRISCSCRSGYKGTYCQTAEPRPTSFTICEGSRNTINCHGKRISVLHASYGRHDRSTCPHSEIHTTSCHAGSSLGIVRSRCNSWSSCTLEATNSVFGDPCHGTYKYLKVTYKCID